MLRLRPLTLDDARAMQGWRYPGPAGTREPPSIERMLDASAFALVTAEGELLGRVVIGEAAQAPDVSYRGEALDLGLALRPDQVGRGEGARFLDAVIGAVCERWAPTRLRATVEDWNVPALRLCRRLGFRTVSVSGGFRRQGGARHHVLALDLVTASAARQP